MIVHDLPTLPVQPILQESAEMPPMADSFLGLRSVLKPPYIYSTEEELTADLARLVDPALDAARKIELELAEIRQRWLPWQTQIARALGIPDRY